MHSFFAKTFGGLNTAYYLRQLFFGAIFAAVIIASVLNTPTGLTFGLVFYVLVNTLLYPYSRFVYESVVGFIMGNNVFFVNALMMLIVKVFTMAICWSASIFIAPLGLAYLYWRNSRMTAN